MAPPGRFRQHRCRRNYTLSSMTNASKNAGSQYTDGDSIPAGNYTLVAYSGFGLGQKPIVAVQSIVKNFDGAIPNVDFEVLPSDVAPEVIYMFGTKKITDGTERWGFNDAGVTATLPANSAIQISFSLPMWRDSLASGIQISPAIAGTWSLSADWLTATYYLDPGVQMNPNQAYEITIFGEDSDPSLPRALNVYGNAIKKTAVGKFTAASADAIGPTVQWNSPTVIEMGGTVDVTQSFRVESNKPLDVNGIALRGSPSIGVKPGVLFLGKTAGGLYVYEFILGEPLKLDTSYSLIVSGGKDLAGHSINTLTGSITTKNAVNTPGIDPAAAAEYQDLQAQVKAVFGKWVRSMNDRNIAQWQSVMSGEFYLEYDVATQGIDSTTDINRDGRYSLGEFSRMLVTNMFPQWEYCGSTIDGVITPTAGDSINVVPLTSTADFEFILTAENTVNLSRCLDTAPRESFYLTLKYKNGSWKIVRGSIGIDNRDKTITKPSLISDKLYQVTFPFSPEIAWRSEVVDGGVMNGIPDNTNLMAKFTWEAATGVQTYILIVTDERQPYNGFALAFPSTVTSFRTDQDPIVDLKGIDIGQKLGFDSFSGFSGGGRYYWEVIGLGTASAVPDPANPNDPKFVGNKTTRDILADIKAVSSVRRFTVAGVFAELSVEVRAGTNMNLPPVVYNPAIVGYDLGSAFQTTMTIFTPNTDVPTATVTQMGGARKTFDVAFNSRTANLTVPLYKGINTFSITETGVPPGRAALRKNFWVLTTGGKQPPIVIWDVTDDRGNTVYGDQWGYYKALGASTINVFGSVTDLEFTSLDYYVTNYDGQFYIQSRGTITTSGSGDNTFTTDTLTPAGLEIYKGNNRIQLSKSIYSAGVSTYYRTMFYVNTDAGSVWVPPIGDVAITNAGSTVATKNADYGTSSDWSVVIDPTANYTVQVTGKFKSIANVRYYVYSDGGYSNGNIVPDGSGNFSFNALLYNGWNQVSIYDAQNNGYWMSINTGTGKPFIKPTITMIDGNAYDPAASNNQYADTDCSATIEGNAEAGQMYVNWNGSLGVNSYYEYMNVQNTTGQFRFTVPLVGPGGSNMVNVQDAFGRNASVTISTTGVCGYEAPTFSITAVKDAAGTVIVPSGTDYSAGTTATVRLEGTSNRQNAAISVRVWTCNQEVNYTAYTAADGSWALPGVNVYGGASGGQWNSFSVQMSGSNTWFSVYSTNTLSPTLRINLSGVTGAGGTSGAVTLTNQYCGYDYWDAGNHTNITVTGTTTVQNGIMYFTDPLNRQGQADIVNYVFTIPNIPVYNGTNNNVRIYNYNDPAGYSSHDMYITSTNGIAKPQFVTITSPAHGSNSVTGVWTVTGTITDPIGSGYSGANATLTASIGGSCNGSYRNTNYSNDSYYQTNYGYLPATVTASGFSFDADFCGATTPEPTYIQVYVYDMNTGTSHYQTIYVNYGASPPAMDYSKPGAKSQPRSGTITRTEMDVMKKSFQNMPK
ncbi:MAG: RHS repeat domain-containing protein [Nitrospirota bacterium]